MTYDPSTASATVLSEIIHIPFSIERRAAELYWSLLEMLLGHRDHHVVLGGIEPDETGGWYVHFLCRDQATITLLQDVAATGDDNPLALLLS
jgi:hypothetical protein